MRTGSIGFTDRHRVSRGRDWRHRACCARGRIDMVKEHTESCDFRDRSAKTYDAASAAFVTNTGDGAYLGAGDNRYEGDGRVAGCASGMAWTCGGGGECGTCVIPVPSRSPCSWSITYRPAGMKVRALRKGGNVSEWAAVGISETLERWS